MFSFKKLILGAALTSLFVLGADPISADTETFVTGGGVIWEGKGPEARKITFSVDMLAAGDGQAAGELQFHFHNIGDIDLDKSRFVSTDFSEFSAQTNDSAELGIYTFVRIRAHGQLNGEEGWSVLFRFTDFGTPVGNKDKSDPRVDAVRIMLFDPFGGEAVYDTALDYPREQVWRTLLDGGNVMVHFRIDSTIP